MKILQIITAILLLTAICFSGQAQSEDFYLKKIKKYQSMKTTGTVLIIGSIPIGLLGGYFLNESNKEFNKDDDDYEGFINSMFSGTGEAILAVVLFAVAGTSLTGGIVLNVIGSNKCKKYQSQLDHLRLGTFITPNQAGFRLTYRF